VQKLLVATGNSHKTREIRAMLGPGYEVSDLSAHPGLPAVEETGVTFLENATLKAVEISRQVPGLVMADDSGLEVDALGGAPGVYSARYARMSYSGDEHRFYIDTLGGRATDDAANNAKLLHELADEENREARFHCVIVLAEGGKMLGSFDGAVEGRIVDVPRGQGGFGYDPLFVPDGYDRTFAELGEDTKNRLSHRARALEKTLAWLSVHSD
jgi:XTP/dITP diphosphohydrolase